MAVVKPLSTNNIEDLHEIKTVIDSESDKFRGNKVQKVIILNLTVVLILLRNREFGIEKGREKERSGDVTLLHFLLFIFYFLTISKFEMLRKLIVQ